MPDQFERHGRSAERDWGSGQGSRSQQRDAAAHDDPVHGTVPSKKKRGLCKGPDGWHASHAMIYELHPERFAWLKRNLTECGWKAGWSIKLQRYMPTWECLHVRVCSRCGREEVMRATQCPVYRSVLIPDEVLKEVDRRQAEYDERLARRITRTRAVRPTISGSQGYRKPKAKGGGT